MKKKKSQAEREGEKGRVRNKEDVSIIVIMIHCICFFAASAVVKGIDKPRRRRRREMLCFASSFCSLNIFIRSPWLIWTAVLAANVVQQLPRGADA